ncbi:HD-GYP domain-containing protein [Roseateles sp. BYS78W]|uniref:HD-GYP domain-containing protein n=1 Tax=Pelomonas candidula TaxID=3299025 RepID=A0ABW7HA25_9BURK
MKLLAKGARVDERTRERLLAHKLSKPLEQCLEVQDAIGSELLKQVSEKLLDEQPLLRALCGRAKPHPVLAALGSLPLPAQLRMLLTLYAELPSDRLEHSVTVALIAHGISQKTLADAAGVERVFLTAGLFHDVGELYIDPRVLKQTEHLAPEQWKHIVVHPVIGHRVLRDMAGAGPMVAEAVLHHHERRDGFGYPNHLAGDALPVRGEILAAAEWLAGMMRASNWTLKGAGAGAKLIPGGFRQSILQAVAPAIAAASPQPREDAPDAADDLIVRLVRVSETMDRYRDCRPWIESLIKAGTPASSVIAANLHRMEHIVRSVASTGLAGEEPLALVARLNAIGDARIYQDLGNIVREIGWRLRELERDTLLRATTLSPEQEDVVKGMIARLKYGTNP